MQTKLPTKLSTEEKPPPMEKMPVGRSVTSTLTMIRVLSVPGWVVTLTRSK